MRIAQRMVSRNYKSSLNKAMSKRAEALRRSEEGSRFTRLSEDLAAGAKAMNTQEMRYAALQQKSTAEALEKELNAAWKTMGSMDAVVQEALEKMKSAAGVRSKEKLDVIKQEIGELKDQYLQLLNNQYGGKYLFGGTNNASAPFTEGEDGKLQFNGVPVAKTYKHEGKFYVMAGDAPDPDNDQLVPQSKDLYLDVGLGLSVGADEVDSRTAFKVNTIGLDLVGFVGFVPDYTTDPDDPAHVPTDFEKDITGLNNIYDLLSEVENQLAPGYGEKWLDAMQMRLTTMNDTMRMARTNVDTRAKSLEDIVSRLTDEISGMEKLEDSLITAQPAGEAINLKDIEYTWNAVLALGSRILPSSLLDYLN